MSKKEYKVTMTERQEKKHSIRFDSKDDKLLSSIYLRRDGLKSIFGQDTMGKVTITISLEE